jgi:hypothetical protein
VEELDGSTPKRRTVSSSLARSVWLLKVSARRVVTLEESIRMEKFASAVLRCHLFSRNSSKFYMKRNSK